MGKNIKQKRLFICWTEENSRSSSLAFHLGAKVFFVHTKISKNKLCILLRYIINSLITLVVLNEKRPDVIFVQNPPVFAILIVWLYCIFFKCRYVADTHSGTFTYMRWAMFLWLYRILSKHALVNLGEVPFQLTTDRIYGFKRNFNVVFVNRYGKNKPIEVVLEAAQKLPLIDFYVTGKIKYMPKTILRRIPDNVILTDYLTNEDYIALIQGCNIVISLTMNNHTMQNGAYEALALGRPIITSNWPVLCHTYYKGALCIENKSDSLVKAINLMRGNYPKYVEEIKALRLELQATWEAKFSCLLELLSSC
ncbi:MAG: glycosyltransferase [Candidatus Sifarchaeia archaeon]|jgi:glycosyltransferase involved in cell wall biosynthesis